MKYTSLIAVPELRALQQSAPVAPVLFDVRFDLTQTEAGRQGFATGHLPGARYLHLDEDLSGPKSGKNGRHPLPDRDRLAATLGTNGLSSDGGQQVVVYDAQGGMIAARAWWLLRWLGYRQVAVLDGGLQAWQEQGYEIQTTTAVPTPTTFRSGTPLVSTVDADLVLGALGSGRLLLVDARSPERFRGENETLDPVGGHIPGAVNRFFRDNLRADGHFKDGAALRAEFGELLGRHPGSRVVLQCGSGVTACHNALAMAVAGLPEPALYAGSWSEWVAEPRRPVETGAPS